MRHRSVLAVRAHVAHVDGGVVLGSVKVRRGRHSRVGIHRPARCQGTAPFCALDARCRRDTVGSSIVTITSDFRRGRG